MVIILSSSVYKKTKDTNLIGIVGIDSGLLSMVSLTNSQPLSLISTELIIITSS